jgi:hypothetical protein
MKTVFINGLMPLRSREFIRALCREFVVVGTGYGALADDPGITVIEPTDVIGEIDFNNDPAFLKRIVDQAEVLTGCLVRDAAASPLGPPEGWDLGRQKHIQMIVPRVAHLMNQMQIFRNFHHHQPVHMLISGADYSSHSRPVVLAARKLDVPTLDIEHGFFFTQMFSAFKPDRGYIPTLFSSDFVNLDNQMEVAIMTDHLKDYPTISPRLLALGTPAATVADKAPDQETARQVLGLPHDRKQVLLLGSWIEARMAGSLLSGQLDTINLFSDIFASLARSGFRDKLDLMIKLHPADCNPQVLPHVSACLTDLAERAGLPAPVIYSDRLAEVLAAADVVLAVSWTSVLWDCFLMEKPAVMLLPDYLTETLKPGWREAGSIPLAEGVMKAAADADDAWRLVEECLEPQQREQLSAKCQKLRQKYHLTDRSVEKTSRDITRWVADFPGI